MTDHVRALIAFLNRQKSLKANRGVALGDVLSRMLNIAWEKAWELCHLAGVHPETMIVKTLKLM